MLTRWDRAERQIWQMVCGIPEQKAREKRLCALQVYFDDSGKVDSSKYQVLAGYLASAEAWASLINEWQALLDEYKLDYFRMSEAWRMARKYRHLTSIQRDQLIVRLIACIVDHAERVFAISVPFEANAHWMGSDQFPEEQSLRAYTQAFWFAMLSVYDYGYRQQFDQKIEVIFDEQGGESAAKILANVDYFRRQAAIHFPQYEVPFPVFREDKTTIPLQSADLVAWLVRRDAYNVDCPNRSELPEALLLQDAYFALPQSTIFITEDMLEGMSNMVAQDLTKIIRDAATD